MDYRKPTRETRFDPDEILRASFNEYDRDGSGELSQTEWRKVALTQEKVSSTDCFCITTDMAQPMYRGTGSSTVAGKKRAVPRLV